MCVNSVWSVVHAAISLHYSAYMRTTKPANLNRAISDVLVKKFSIRLNLLGEQPLAKSTVELS